MYNKPSDQRVWKELRRQVVSDEMNFRRGKGKAKQLKQDSLKEFCKTMAEGEKVE